jgi:hypothetical protein
MKNEGRKRNENVFVFCVRRVLLCGVRFIVMTSFLLFGSDCESSHSSHSVSRMKAGDVLAAGELQARRKELPVP